MTMIVWNIHEECRCYYYNYSMVVIARNELAYALFFMMNRCTVPHYTHMYV